MEPITNRLLLAVLIVASFVKFLFYFPTRRFSSWFQSLKTSPQISHFKSSSAAEKKTEKLKKVFATFDKNNDGFITKKELMESLKNMRMLITKEEAEEMLKGVDENGDGLIDLEEFCVLGEKMMMKRGTEDEDEDEDELKEVFGVFDKDKDGMISVEELSLVLCCLGLNEGKKVENCEEMIKKVDFDGDGMVNFYEFKRMMRNGGRFVLAKS